ncbi:DUF4168 domain-containing protein [Arenibacter latericius]|uniref:DUF4168 domain-containing protein n=1 Tax=Arenibacter latericius TaxID=86104 RepID=UPI000404E45E|nr:DUF4168 domain-containing protein [Arenibacter latericius]MDX1364196.1 DUF4168 domain-containing protein [Arenibacter latericius]
MFKSVRVKSVFLFVALLGTIGLSAQGTSVSDAELTRFATAYQKLQIQQQVTQQTMMKAIEEEGIEVKRFSEIQQASMDPNKEVEATKEEMELHKKALSKIEKMQPELEKKINEEITSTGMTMEQFEALAKEIQQDRSLQERLQAIMVKSQG